MANNKVVLRDGSTLIDLTADTVSPAVLRKGYTAHDKSGALIEGAYDPMTEAYPVGSIYMSVVSTDPGVLFGVGEWERIENTFLLAAGDQYAAGSVGGEERHTLSVSEMPSHNHTSTSFPSNGTPSWVWGSGYTIYAASDSIRYPFNAPTNSVGGGAAHNNMPPYLAVYVWKRIA